MWPRFQDRNSAPHILGEPAEVPGPDVLNPLDDAYEKLLAKLRPAEK